MNPSRRRSPWFYEECTEDICAKNEARRKKLQREMRPADDHYREMRRVANRVIGRKKRNYERAELHDMEILRNRNEIRKFYKKLKGQIQGFKASNTSICFSKSGTLITNPADVTKRWVEYFNDLLNGNIEISPNLPVFHSTASGEQQIV